ncbi:hypothetical protein [Sphingomonas sp. Mn802worker]|uniref:hypothetical protein n=1 Tax=Sphingomonas sp. Mn802worker TaxID=629773 RepID=UPI00036C9D3E|nr:hypothetical protein [Sphingomonas sp. Mn802worker]
MRLILLALLLPIAACGKGGDGKSGDAGAKGSEGAAATAAPMATPTGPPPKTPVMQVTLAPGKQPGWLQPRSDKGDPKSAPYGNLLDQPVVNASAR